MSEIRTRRARLRRFRLDDLDHMVELESDAEIMKFTPSRVPLSREESEKRLRALVEKEQLLSPWGVWAAELGESGEFVGWFMLLRTEYEFPELGFMVVRRLWGRGLASELAGALVRHALEELGAAGLVATTNPENQISKRVLAKIGFRYDREVSVPDRILKHPIPLHLLKLSKATPS
jgi:RimJ/RimL family protein N-acetyltransferase